MTRESFRRRDLPHWDKPDVFFFVTACLHGSIPAHGLADLQHFRQCLEARPRPDNIKQDECHTHLWKLEFARADQWLDDRPAVRWLERPDLAQIVMNSLLHFAGERYELRAFVVMPSHFHWVFRPLDEWVGAFSGPQCRRSPREQIMHSVKAYSSRKCNEVLSRQGAFWQAESYDHWVRDSDELERIIRYIEDNPVKARLARMPEDWRFSSAWLRKQNGLPFGSPISRFLTLPSN